LDAARIIVSPDGGLQQVPFAALSATKDGPRQLERSEIVLVPPASLVAAIHRPGAPYPRRIAVFADAVFSAADLRLTPLIAARPIRTILRVFASRAKNRPASAKSPGQTRRSGRISMRRPPTSVAPFRSLERFCTFPHMRLWRIAIPPLRGLYFPVSMPLGNPSLPTCASTIFTTSVFGASS
jgi:hypothetical protein